MAKKELKRTPVSDWRQDGELVELPSGKVAELRRPNLLAMLRDGGDDVPNFLKAYVARKLTSKNGTGDDENPMQNIKDPMDAVDTLIFLAKSVFVYPRLVDGEPQADDEVRVSDMDVNDLSYASAYALGDPEAIQRLKRFRDEKEGDVEPVPAGE